MAGEFGNPTDAQIVARLNSRGKASPLAGYVAQIRTLAAQYHVPIAIILAHAAVESGYGTDQNQLTAVYNFFGLTGKGSKGSVRICHDVGGGQQKCWDFAAFGSVQEGLQAAISNMGSSGYQGLTLWQYFARYLTGSPTGTSDGAGNNVSNYVNTALEIIRNLGGTATMNTVVVPKGDGPGGGGPGGSPEPAPGPPPSSVPSSDLPGIDLGIPGLPAFKLPSADEWRAAAVAGVMLVVGIALVLIGANGLASENSAISAAKQTIKSGVDAGASLAGKVAAGAAKAA